MHTQLKSILFGLLIVALIALAVYLICAYIAQRPDIGRTGAAIVAVIGCLLVVLDNT